MMKTDIGSPNLTMEVAEDESLSAKEAPTELMGSVVERDEIKEVKYAAKRENRLVKFWRWALTILLILTAFAVTHSSYQNYKSEQESKTIESFREFAETVQSNVLERQERLRFALRDLSETLTTTSSGSEWPYFTLSRFEHFASSALYHSKAESITVLQVVKDVPRWLNYSETNHEDWMKEGYQIYTGAESPIIPVKDSYYPYLTKKTEDGVIAPQDLVYDEYFVSWSESPPPRTYQNINWDYQSDLNYAQAIEAARYINGVVYSAAESQDAKDFRSLVFQPIHAVLGSTRSDVVAFVVARLSWSDHLMNILPDDVKGLRVILRNTCNQRFTTYALDGKTVEYTIGEGATKQAAKSVDEVSFSINTESDASVGDCVYTMTIFPSEEFKRLSDDSKSSRNFTIVIAMTFVTVILFFLIYDTFVQRRNDKLIERAAKASAVVAALFPGGYREVIMEQAIAAKDSRGREADSSGTSENITNDEVKDLPLADLYPHATILFADIAGFTAWSSIRQPCQVFVLLETLYAKFDKAARKRKVFKVETIGDCYVAVTGLPEPQDDQSIVMCRFAYEILNSSDKVFRELEVSLGFGTSDLKIRIGMHSGPVTAGVLRGEKARFQLFGDTVNVASRMESNGKAGCIQMSQTTANPVVEAGKGYWIEPREDLVSAKGKGTMQYYWLQTCAQARRRGSMNSVASMNSDDGEEKRVSQESFCNETDQHLRLISWHVETILRFLRQIAARRTDTESELFDMTEIEKLEQTLLSKTYFIEEISEVIDLPEYERCHSHGRHKEREVRLNEAVVNQARDFVTCIASLHRSNSFHNFEHASHVTMSMIKFLSRIESTHSGFEGYNASSPEDLTYGITSDPLTGLACAFSTLIHSVDHTGVPNSQLIDEGAPLAAHYNNGCPAEQNALAISWTLLMDDRYKDFRAAVYSSADELTRFRKLVVNVVLSTDTQDEDLVKLRNDRWDRAFVCPDLSESEIVARNRKATVVIEHLIQASDIAHTMQHWYVYCKWNQCLYDEAKQAFKEGRAKHPPSTRWYMGQIGVFDQVVIPLATKLNDCGVFGDSSDEYLNSAQSNRAEWERSGQEVLGDMMGIVLETMEQRGSNTRRSLRRCSIR